MNKIYTVDGRKYSVGSSKLEQFFVKFPNAVREQEQQDSTDDPIAVPCYSVGDIGPGGGVIVLTPDSNNNYTNYYYELGPIDLISGTTTLEDFITVDTGINPTSTTGPFLSSVIPGAEWGSYKSYINLPPPTGWLIGEGENNTNVLTSQTQCPPPGSCHPVYPYNFIAAQLCADYTGGGLTDWFLPSWFEWNATIQSDVFDDTLYPGNGQYFPTGELYWSSTPASGGGQPDGKAFAAEPQTGQLTSGYRSRTLSVRPMRRFLHDCSIDYDYRIVKSNNAYHPYLSSTQAGCIQGITSNVSNLGVNDVPFDASINDIIGDTNLAMHMPSKDIRRNNVFSFPHAFVTYLQPDATTYIGLTFNIKLYSQEEVLIGDWDYMMSGTSINACGATQCKTWIYFTLVSTNYGSSTSVTNLVDINFTANNALINHNILKAPYLSVTNSLITSNSLANGRGNTINLVNYLGSGVSNRQTSANPVPSVGYSWPWNCGRCSHESHGDNTATSLHRYMAEIPPYLDNFVGPPQLILYPWDDITTPPCSWWYGGASKMFDPNLSKEDNERIISAKDLSIFLEKNDYCPED